MPFVKLFYVCKLLCLLHCQAQCLESEVAIHVWEGSWFQAQQPAQPWRWTSSCWNGITTSQILLTCLANCWIRYVLIIFYSPGSPYVACLNVHQCVLSSLFHVVILLNWWHSLQAVNFMKREDRFQVVVITLWYVIPVLAYIRTGKAPTLVIAYRRTT